MQRPKPRVVESRPIPESSFISAAQSRTSAPDPRPNTIMQGALAQKLLAMQKEKNKAIEDQKIAMLEGKYSAQVKKAGDNSLKKLE